MPRHRHVDPIFRYRSHEDTIIVLYPSTIWRWVQRFVPEFEKRRNLLKKAALPPRACVGVATDGKPIKPMHAKREDARA